VLTLKGNYYGEDSNVTYRDCPVEDEYRADPRQNPFANDFFYGDRAGVSRHAQHGARAAPACFGCDAGLTLSPAHSAPWWRQSRHSGQRHDGAPALRRMANLLTDLRQ